MVKCLIHGLRGFSGAVQRRLATLTVTMLISSCWQLSSEVELRRIFDVCKRWANSGSHEFVKKNMVRYMKPHGRFAHCIFILAVRQPPVLASCIEIYYLSQMHAKSELDQYDVNIVTVCVARWRCTLPLKAQDRVSSILCSSRTLYTRGLLFYTQGYYFAS